MKAFSIFLFAVCLTATAVAHAECPDLTGVYSSPFGTPELSTTYIITQSACDSVIVTSNTFYQGIYTSNRGAVFNLDGTPAQHCFDDSFATCGSLKASPDAIEKVDPKAKATGDEEHGYCRYKSTFLTKDSSGNLVETIREANCLDGYTGPLKPLVYPKQ